MKVMITGGREYTDRVVLYNVLDYIHFVRNIDILINGNARGADTLSTSWAQERGVPLDIHPAKWNVKGKFIRSAGMKRNAEMLNEGPDLLVMFPGGRGTKGCVKMARKRKVAVYIVNEEHWYGS